MENIWVDFSTCKFFYGLLTVTKVFCLDAALGTGGIAYVVGHFDPSIVEVIKVHLSELIAMSHHNLVLL